MKWGSYFLILLLIMVLPIFVFGAATKATSSALSSITTNTGVATMIDNVISISASKVLLSGSIKLEGVKIDENAEPLNKFEFFNTNPGYGIFNLVQSNDNLAGESLQSFVVLNSNIFGYLPIENANITTESSSLNSLLFINDYGNSEFTMTYQNISTPESPISTMLYLNYSTTTEYPMKYVKIPTHAVKTKPSTKTGK